MEERKKIRPLGIAALVLAALLLAILCFFCAGLEDWSLGLGRWGVYSTGAESVYLAEAYQQTGPDDLLITDRTLSPTDGALVTYRQNGRRVVDLYDELLGRPVLDDGSPHTRLRRRPISCATRAASFEKCTVSAIWPGRRQRFWC